MVKTKLVINSKDEVPLSYLLNQTNNRWKIFDVLIDGSISEIATKKSEFINFTNEGNLKPLLEALQKKTQCYLINLQIKLLRMADFDKIKLLHKSYRLNNFKPKNLFSASSSKKENIISLSFFITTMSLEILLNQPFKKKIKIFHNNLLNLS